MILPLTFHSKPSRLPLPRPPTFLEPRRRLHIHIVPLPQTSLPNKPLSQFSCRSDKASNFAAKLHDPHEQEGGNGANACPGKDSKVSNFWGAITLIIGTAVGPGMLGLPSLTIKSGPLPSTAAIVLSWVYVTSSIILIAELTFEAMEEDGAEEVSFTSLATKSFGSRFGAFVAVVYASLSFALLVACVSGIGSIIIQCCRSVNPMLAYALCPLAVGVTLRFFPFKAIDSVNRLLCVLMLISITSLVAIGLSVTRANVIKSFSHSSWRVSSILPAIPVTVLTLGFHVITPFICKIAGETIQEARKVVLIGGMVPLVMVLSWNLIVLGLSGEANSATCQTDPIALLLSVNPSALPAVQGFAFSALATSLIGYAVSFPKQLLDTLDLIFRKNDPKGKTSSNTHMGKVGIVEYNLGNSGTASFNGNKDLSISEQGRKLSFASPSEGLVAPVVLGASILIATLFRSTFSKALDFAGVYANCFLFGILPPLMAYIQLSRKKMSSTAVPGGNLALLLLFSIAVALAIWH